MSPPVPYRRRPRPPVQDQLDLFGDCSTSRGEAPIEVASPEHTVVVTAPEAITAPLIKGSLIQREPRAPSPPKPAIINSLADVLRAVEAAAEPEPARDGMRSAVKMVGKVLDRPLGEISAEPPILAKLLGGANPALVRMTRNRWIRVRSQLRSALAEAGVKVFPGRCTAKLSPAWKALSDRLVGQRLKYGLSRLVSYFSREGIEPEHIDAERLAEFQRALVSTSLDADAAANFNTIARLWNEAAETIDGWPQARAEPGSDLRRFSGAWADLPAGYRADSEAFLTHTGNQDRTADDYAPSVKPSTIRSRKKGLRVLGSALLNAGVAKEDLVGLATLVDLANARAALRWLIERNGGETSPQIGNLAYLIRTIARHWVKVGPEHDAALKKLVSQVYEKQRGMKPKNRERLRQFDLVENRFALLGLPGRVFTEVARSDRGGKGEAVRVTMALAVELLTVGAMRIDNLVGLEVERHLKVVRRGSQISRHIAIPEAETKTGVAFEIALAPESAALLATYLERYRSRVYAGPSAYLFPGRGGARRSTGSFSNLLTKFVKRETGLTMHAHLFRHLVGKLHLEANPNDIETVRQILGHTTTRITLGSYAEIRNAAANRAYDATLKRDREAGAHLRVTSTKKPRKGSK